MRKRGVSSAYQALQAALAATGRQVSATQLERWCYWRTGGLVDHPIKHGAGRGTWSEFADLARACQQAAAVADELRPRERLDTLALRLYGKGRDLLAIDVKAAFIAELASLRRRFERDARADQTDDPFERASNAGRAAYRLFTRGQQARTRRESGAKTSSADTWAIVGRILLGDPIPAHQLSQSISDSPIGSVLSLMFRVESDDAALVVATVAPMASFDALTAMLGSRSPESIAAALRIADRVSSAATKWVPSLTAHADEGLTLGIALGLLANPAHDLAGVPDDVIADHLRDLPVD